MGINGGITMANLGTGAWPTTNLAYYVPVNLTSPAHVSRFFWANGTTAQTDNLQVGVYSKAGVAIVRGTSTTASGVSALQFDNVTDFTLSAGSYYIALWCSGTTTHTLRQIGTSRFARSMGILQQTIGGGLPSTATMTNIVTIYIPVFGLALRASP